jgi:Putative Actinobacterial Holin-X, holin superfamily III
MTASSSPAPKPSPRPDRSATNSSDGSQGASAPKHATPSEPPATSTAAVAASTNGAPSRTGAKHAAEPSVGQLVSDASTHLSNLIHSEIELAKLELRSTVKNAGTGAGFFAAAAVVLVFSLTFGFFALAEGIAALGLDRWLAFLIVFGAQVLVAGLCVYIGIKKVKRIRAPERTIKTTRETVDYLKNSRG